MESFPEIRVKDLGAIAALVASDFTPIRIDYTDRFAVFVFERTPGATTALDLYFLGRLSVDAKTYFAAIRSTKDSIFAGRPDFRGTTEGGV